MFHFSVMGKGDFPFVMLARSKAYPVDAQEAHKIALSCPTVAPEQTIWLESRDAPNPKIWEEEKWPIQKLMS